MANDVILDLGNEYIGSAYSPVVEVTENEDGHTISITSADPDAAGHLVTQSFDVPNYSSEEEGREAAEAMREAQEASRQAAEAQRQSAEEARAAAESERQLYEDQRRLFESTRSQAESERRSNESQRQGNEAQRQAAETTRQQHELAREAASRAAVSNANSAATDARTAAMRANSWADEAEAATGRADDAATAANAAAETANTAAGTASTAAQTANTAADAANAARESIDSHLRWADGNVLVGHLPEGDLLRATDAYATLPVDATVYGASTQDGTPTPDAPVPIVSVGAANLLDPADIVDGTGRGLTATYEGDGWVRVSGTVTGSTSGILVLWGSTDSTVAYIDSPGDRISLLIEDDGVLADEAIGVQLYGKDAGGTNQYAIYYEPGLKLTSVGRYAMLVSRICVYINALATGTTVDGRLRLTLVRGYWPLYAHVPFGSVALMAVGTDVVRGGGGETVLTKTMDDAQLLWGGNADTALPHLHAGTRVTVSYECKASVAATLTPYLGTKNEANVLVSSWSTTKAAVGTAWATVTRTGTLNSDADNVWLTSDNTTPSGTEILVRDVRVTLDDSTEYQPYVETVTPIDLDGHELRSLPDGTRDELTVDSLGNVTLTQRVGSTTQAATEGVTGTVGVDVMSTTGEIADGATVTYALATPVTHDLGLVTLPTLPSPDLTAWSMADVPTTMALTYERDIELALTEARDEAMAAIADPDGPTATANHAAGTYLTMGGRLYRVTTAIATGEAIVPGTNVVATTVMAEVIALAQ